MYQHYYLPTPKPVDFLNAVFAISLAFTTLLIYDYITDSTTFVLLSFTTTFTLVLVAFAFMVWVYFEFVYYKQYTVYEANTTELNKERDPDVKRDLETENKHLRTRLFKHLESGHYYDYFFIAVTVFVIVMLVHMNILALFTTKNPKFNQQMGGSMLQVLDIYGLGHEHGIFNELTFIKKTIYICPLLIVTPIGLIAAQLIRLLILLIKLSIDTELFLGIAVICVFAFIFVKYNLMEVVHTIWTNIKRRYNVLTQIQTLEDANV
jgi:hypothetical protein